MKKYRKVPETEKTFSPVTTPYHSKGTDGSHIRAFTEGVTVAQIPNTCWCTWNYINGRWHLKFRHRLCPVYGKGHK